MVVCVCTSSFAFGPAPRNRSGYNPRARVAVVYVSRYVSADNRREPIMQSYEVLREAADEVGVKVLANELRVSPALVYKWCQSSGQDETESSGARNPLDRLADIVRVTGHRGVVSWLCHEAAGFFVRNPHVEPDEISAEALQATQRLVGEFSDLLQQVSRSLADDDQITPDEADQIRDHWQTLKGSAETFVVACERGLFGDRAQPS